MTHGGPRWVTPLPPLQLERQDRGAARLLAAATPGGKTVLSQACSVLADIAEPPNMKRAYESSLSIVSFTTQVGDTAGCLEGTNR